MKISKEQRKMIETLLKGEIISSKYQSIFNLMNRVLTSNEYTEADKVPLNFIRDTYLKNKRNG
jgi:ABC-type enterochelin transport system permease subunit